MNDPRSTADADSDDGFNAALRDQVRRLERELAERQRAETVLERHCDALEQTVAVRAGELLAARARAEDAVAAAGVFMAGVGGEMRRPLADILGHAGLIGCSERLSTPERHGLAAIERNTRQLLALVDELPERARREIGSALTEADPDGCGGDRPGGQGGDDGRELSRPWDEVIAAVVPPAYEIEALHELALTGDMRAIRRQMAQLIRIDERYRGFAERIDALARSFQSRAILGLAKHCLVSTEVA